MIKTIDIEEAKVYEMTDAPTVIDTNFSKMEDGWYVEGYDVFASHFTSSGLVVPSGTNCSRSVGTVADAPHRTGSYKGGIIHIPFDPQSTNWKIEGSMNIFENATSQMGGAIFAVRDEDGNDISFALVDGQGSAYSAYKEFNFNSASINGTGAQGSSYRNISSVFTLKYENGVVSLTDTATFTPNWSGTYSFGKVKEILLFLGDYAWNSANYTLPQTTVSYLKAKAL